MIKNLEIDNGYFAIESDRKNVDGENIATATGSFGILSNGTVRIDLYANIRVRDELADTIKHLIDVLHMVEAQAVNQQQK